jgi:hypothetical protein
MKNLRPIKPVAEPAVHPHWQDAVTGLSWGIFAMCLLFTPFCVSFICLMGKVAPILWYGFGACMFSLLVCLFIYLRMEKTRPFFARALLAGACLAAVLLVAAVCILDNFIGFSA